MKIAALALSVALLTGCAAAQFNREVAEFQAWSVPALAQVKAGQLKYSVYYTEAYNRLAQGGSSTPTKLVAMKAFADMIPVARAYEAGQITLDQFEDAKRATRIAVDQQSQALEAQRQQAIAAILQQAAVNMRASQPVTTSCSSFGNYASCTTR